MNQPMAPKPASTDDRALIADLRVDVDSANNQLARLTAEYEAMLSDQDTIQEDRDTTAQLVAQARSLVAQAEAALLRAEQGRYGRCDRCGASIAAERLAALPDATTCVSCA